MRTADFVVPNFVEKIVRMTAAAFVYRRRQTTRFKCYNLQSTVKMLTTRDCTAVIESNARYWLKIAIFVPVKGVPVGILPQSCTTLDPTRGSGRVRKFAGNGGSGRVQFGQKLKFYFEVSWYLCFILHFSFSISRVVFSV